MTDAAHPPRATAPATAEDVPPARAADAGAAVAGAAARGTAAPGAAAADAIAAPGAAEGPAATGAVVAEAADEGVAPGAAAVGGDAAAACPPAGDVSADAAAGGAAATGPAPVAGTDAGADGRATAKSAAAVDAAAAEAAGGGDGAAGVPVVLSVRNLHVRFRMPRGRAAVRAVTDVSLDVRAGECLALVGESGCGKSVLASALLGLLPANAETAGHARLGGVDLLTAGERVLAREVRGRLAGLIPQSPAAHLTPVRTIRSQLEETVAQLTGVRGRAALRAAAEQVAARAAFPPGHLDRHPHELSGGLAQRAATALALAGDAPLLLADEPTTGLDRDLVDHTVDELRRHVDDGAGRALLMITHDLAAAERVADRVAVMYAGRVVEVTGAEAFFGTPGPRHPYSRGLLDALPERAFTPIPGLPPPLDALPSGCAFAPRCAFADRACAVAPSAMSGVACHHPREVLHAA